MKKNILISTGGSGGHVVPAMILYDHLLKDTNVIISTDKIDIYNYIIFIKIDMYVYGPWYISIIYFE